MTRRELMHRMGCDELREWLAFERIHPFEDGYWQAAMVAYVVAKANGAKNLKFEHLLPTRSEPKARRQTGPEMLAIVRRAVRTQTRKEAG